MEVEVTGNGVSGQGPTEFPFDGAVGHEGPLQDSGSRSTEIAAVGRRPGGHPEVGGVGNDGSRLAADKTRQVNHGLSSCR